MTCDSGVKRFLPVLLCLQTWGWERCHSWAQHIVRDGNSGSHPLRGRLRGCNAEPHSAVSCHAGAQRRCICALLCYVWWTTGSRRTRAAACRFYGKNLIPWPSIE